MNGLSGGAAGRRRIPALALSVLLTTPIPAAAADRIEIPWIPFTVEIGDREVSFLARNLDTGTDHVLAGSDLDTRHAPWSSFKIANLLIALETGAASSIDDRRTWNASRRPAAGYWPKSWRGDHSLLTAFRHSVVWYFRDVALDVGTDRYRQFLAEWRYGNARVTEGSDRFWLGESLQISVREQVAFLAALLQGRLAVAVTSMDALQTASLVERENGAALHGKTGSGPIVRGRFGGAFEGWYVGWVLREDRRPVVFALYAHAPSFAASRDFRKRFSVRLLKAAGLLPGTFPG